MNRLLQRFSQNNGRGLGQRPSRDEYRGINQNSIQAQGLAAWWPLWETSGSFAMDYGQFQMHMTPSVNTWMVPDPMMGMCWFGQPVAQLSPGAGQAFLRRYAASMPEGPYDPVDFGSLPGNSSTSTPSGVSYMSTAWVNTLASGLTYTTADTPPDSYVYTFDRADATNFPGHSMVTINRTPNGGVQVAPCSAAIFDNAVNNNPYGVMSMAAVNDGQWHLLCGIYNPPTFAGGLGNQWIMVDGDIGFVGGQDLAGSPNGTQPFGHSIQQTILGSPQDATHASINPGGLTYQFIGCDDDGHSSPFLGFLSDHRLYAFPAPPSIKSSYPDATETFMAIAKSMYAPESRWELYKPAINRTYSISKPAAAGATIAYPGFEAINPFPRLERMQLLPRG